MCIEGANPNCTEEGCYGSGFVCHYWKNEKEKLVDSDWSYCQSCFPGSTSYLKRDAGTDWVTIEVDEFEKAVKEDGYRESV